MDLKLQLLLKTTAAAGPRTLPFVTLTYAQSIDGSISATRGTPLLLSCSASMRMTHELRVTHDAIVVGIGTLIADNPSLTARLVEGANPQPVIIDAELMTPLGCKLLTQATCRKPILCARDPPVADAAWRARRRALEAAGAIVLDCAAVGSTRIDLRDAMRQLGARGLRSVMVEGGSSIITSLVHPDAFDLVIQHFFLFHRMTEYFTNLIELLNDYFVRRQVDALVVTVAPMFVGGLSAVSSLLPPVSTEGGTAYAKLDVKHLALVGEDIVFLATPRSALP